MGKRDQKNLCKSGGSSYLFALDEVSLRMGEELILSDLTLDIKPRGVLGIIGPSGSGKSTFLRLLNKLISPSSGKVYYKGNDLATIPAREVRKEVGMLQQKPYLFQGTVRENILYGPNLWGVSYAEEEIQQLLEKVSLSSSFLERNVQNLSVGEQQRVSLARTLANTPATLLLDEPTSSLDIASKEVIEETLRDLKQEGIKIIIVTHSLNQTKTLTDQLLFLKNRELMEKTPTTQFFKKYNEQQVRKFFQTEGT